jgi:hypothetical protein
LSGFISAAIFQLSVTLSISARGMREAIQRLSRTFAKCVIVRQAHDGMQVEVVYGNDENLHAAKISADESACDGLPSFFFLTRFSFGTRKRRSLPNYSEHRGGEVCVKSAGG